MVKFSKFLIALAKALQIIVVAALVATVIGGAYFFGYLNGVETGSKQALELFGSSLSAITLETFDPDAAGPTPTPVTVYVERTRKASAPPPNWSGPELWDVVNDRRVELGVNPLGQRDELCTIASIRLNELLALGTLDGHEGFSSLPDRREDLTWIYDQFNLAEFLLKGAQTPEEAAQLWENTLGHKKLLTGGEYVWGCIYAQNSFAVAITAF